ncbi:hypothetical protein [Actinoplanes sp. L3-i22]|uniref:hypothetical protein n=1 Tax=Actinoplanes sp. L3-i22 TaxID=2836373 RepID=UPI001C84BCD2|nr:hypothetical protein [Actinoplanes sp. L3-i22]
MTTQEHQHQQTADQRIPDTEVIAVATPAPVFVDSTGRRSRMLRRIALAFGILVVSYGGLVSISLAGGPVSSSAVLPLPGLDDDEKADPVPPRPGPAPAAIPSSTPARAPVESTGNPARQPARPASVTAKPAASTKPAATKAPTKAATKPTPAKTTPTPAVTTTKPTESTTTPATTEPATTKAPDPAPPAPPVTTKSTTRSEPTALPTLAPVLGADPADNDSPGPSSSGASA